ncbi:MAG: sulfatase-like hydrolase/transferase, partial [Clostridia bacterium]|nr:sulfatase-like hydrolase/transferase [Clostridia bacterium]
DADANSTSGSFVQSKTNYMPFSTANMFNGINASTYAFHNFKGYYYQRNKTHANLGFQNLRFMGGTGGMKFTTSWPSSDFEMMEQSIDDYINDEQFHAYYMTFSGHGPYSEANPIAVRNLETVKELLGDRKMTETAKYYLAANYELEKAMSLLLEKLEAAGKLDKTMIVIAGDHYPYYLSEYHYNSLAGHKVDTNFEKYSSTCIMYCSGMETIKVDAPCSNVDILPTVYNLFGMEYDSRLLMGTDVFSNNTHIAMLYNKSFITDKVKYNAQKGKVEWLPGTENMSETEKESYLEYCISTTKLRYAASLDVIEENFYRFVFGEPVVDKNE